MNQPLFAAVGLLLFAGGQDLQTKYEAERILRVEVESVFSMEVTDFSMERDGEPMEGRFGAGGGSTESRHLVIQDTVVESEGGRPTQVLREFVELGGDSVRSRGDQEFESERECPLNEVTLELTMADGDVICEVKEGSEPDDEALLEGHNLTLALDALLPEDDVDVGDEWELSGESLAQALMFDLEPALYPVPEREESPEGGEGRGGRRGGTRGGRGGGGAARYITTGIWDAKAKLEAEQEEYAGVSCFVISIEGECLGVLPEPERGEGGGRGRGGRMLQPTSPALENSFEMEIEAKLYIDAEAGRPVHFELEGVLSTESTREMNRGESTMVISSAQEGTFSYTVDLTAIDSSEDSE